MPTATPAIAILGAGPSGLMLARLLEVKQIDYVVFERDDSATAVGQGGTLDIHTGSGQTALQKAGLFDKFKALARYDGQAFKVVDKDGNEVLNMTPDGREDRPEIDRKELRQLLLDSVPAGRIRWGHRVESVYRDESGSMAVRFDGGRVEEGFRLVVGADGAWSKARSLVRIILSIDFIAYLFDTSRSLRQNRNTRASATSKHPSKHATPITPE